MGGYPDAEFVKFKVIKCGSRIDRAARVREVCRRQQKKSRGEDEIADIFMLANRLHE